MTEDAELRLVADPSLTRLAQGRVLLGGSPYRVVRLSEAGSRLLDTWLEGAPVAPRQGHRRLASRLLDGGLVRPVRTAARLGAAEVTAVVPVRDAADEVARLLPGLRGLASVLVVDDGSAVPVPGAAVRHRAARGPAAARNSGWRLAATELVAFLDADVRVAPGWLDPLLRHFDDPEVVAVAPRVRSSPGPGLLARYERSRSPLDLGGEPGPVRPGAKVSYVPSAALLVRRSALARSGGFDERMRYGEDVDLVWRLAAAGGRVRYEPESQVWHLPRPDWAAWARQRYGYGTSAAPLALRHRRAVAPVKVSPWSAAAWAAAALGHPAVGVALAGGTAALLPRKLEGIGVPSDTSVRLAVQGHLGAGRLLADALTRPWGPVAVPALACSARGRRVLAAAFGRHVLEWCERRPEVPLPAWIGLRIADDLAYGAGVWRGALRHRTAAPLLPDLGDWPGRDGVSSWRTTP